MRTTCALGATLALLSLSAVGAAQLFQDNFDVDSSANWGVNKSTGANANDAGSNADFFFDYSTYGISSAPGAGGTTRGLRLEANRTGGVFSGLSVSPLGQSFTGDYKVSAHVWMNFVGPAPVGGSGSTQAGGMGIGTSGGTAQWAASSQESVHFSTTLDGNSAVDYRAYSSAAGTGYGDASSVFFASGAGNRNASHSYYSGFGGVTPPAAQALLYPSQTGATMAGNIGFTWQLMEVEKVGNTATWSIGGLDIAQIDLNTVTMGGSNILFNYFDTNAGSTTHLDRLNFMLVDNVVVTPEPGSMAALGLGIAAVLRRRRK